MSSACVLFILDQMRNNCVEEEIRPPQVKARVGCSFWVGAWRYR
ncbi:hypothetical protein Patl1_02524 [Pistacia atlantica]|uniref:Uncharacterized protein n=1 Tax=Pistacia atlantica TaxID=434234 RepID=A0ACC1CC42_9ROSI|nr:hypothetical protein Patl1_02524 [Pistacia atlantica]